MQISSKSKKAQVLTYDFFIALGVFLLVLVIIMGYWYYAIIQMEEINEKNSGLELLFIASDVWFKEGSPKYWSPSNVVELGLSNDGKINQTKVNMLNELGYEKVIGLLNLGMYNVKYILYNVSNELIFEFPQNNNYESARDIYKEDRIGVLNEFPVKIRVIVWR